MDWHVPMAPSVCRRLQPWLQHADHALCHVCQVRNDALSIGRHIQVGKGDVRHAEIESVAVPVPPESDTNLPIDRVAVALENLGDLGCAVVGLGELQVDAAPACGLRDVRADPCHATAWRHWEELVRRFRRFDGHQGLVVQAQRSQEFTPELPEPFPLRGVGYGCVRVDLFHRQSLGKRIQRFMQPAFAQLPDRVAGQ